MGIRRGPPCQQVRLGGLEVEVVQNYRPGLDLLRSLPIVDVVWQRLLHSAWAEVWHLFIAIYRLVCAIGICQHQGVLVDLMGEEVVDSMAFHQPANKVEIRFPVLNHELTRRVVTGQ